MTKKRDSGRHQWRPYLAKKTHGCWHRRVKHRGRGRRLPGARLDEVLKLPIRWLEARGREAYHARRERPRRHSGPRTSPWGRLLDLSWETRPGEWELWRETIYRTRPGAGKWIRTLILGTAPHCVEPRPPNIGGQTCFALSGGSLPRNPLIQTLKNGAWEQSLSSLVHDTWRAL